MGVSAACATRHVRREEPAATPPHDVFRVVLVPHEPACQSIKPHQDGAERRRQNFHAASVSPAGVMCHSCSAPFLESLLERGMPEAKADPPRAVRISINSVPIKPAALVTNVVARAPIAMWPVWSAG